MNNKDLLHGLEHGATDGLIQIWVPGNPRVYPTLEATPLFRNPRCPVCKSLKYQGVRQVPRDWTYYKDPITGKRKKKNKGLRAAWANEIKSKVGWFMDDNKIQMFPKNHPIGLGALFYIPRPKSNKLPFPSLDPDMDNFVYAVWNALSGILYHDDNQIITRIMPEALLWATEENPPGVLISVQCVNRRLGRECDCQQQVEQKEMNL